MGTNGICFGSNLTVPRFANIYVGYGYKYSAQAFTPELPPAPVQPSELRQQEDKRPEQEQQEEREFIAKQQQAAAEAELEEEEEEGSGEED